MATALACERCGNVFVGKRSTARFCSPSCRSAARSGGVAASHRRRSERRAEGRQGRFVGLDGEGVIRPDGAHDYVLMSIGDEPFHRPDWSALSFLDCARAVVDYQRRHPADIIVGFALGYDFAQWCKTLPRSRAERLFTTEGQLVRRKKRFQGEPYPVDYRELQVDFLPNLKRFRVRRAGDKSYAYVMDAFAFFQSSFQNVLAQWPDIDEIATPEEQALIERGKTELRKGLLLPHGEAPPQIYVDYNLTENRVLGRLMEHLREGFHATGINLNRKQWFGPGQAAQAWMRTNVVDHVGDSVRAVSPPEVMAANGAAQASYYGGWFEILAHGLVNGPVYNYDINSAYPMVISQLPCLLHGTWDREPGGDLELVAAAVIGANELCGPAPYRNHRTKSISRPRRSIGWFWRHELEAAERAGLLDTVHIGGRWSYRACDCPPPFAGVEDLYQGRIRDNGRYKNTPDGKSRKLTYNSMYGKMAQSVGHPAYANPVYASLITSGCRAMILDAIATHPGGVDALVMVATDGAYFTSRHTGLELDKLQLGAWDETVYDRMYLNKPGSYWGVKSDSLDVKSRGVGITTLRSAIDEFEEKWNVERRATYNWARPGEPVAIRWPKVDLRIPFSVTSIKAAMNSLNDWDRVGETMHDTIHTETTDPTNKRRSVAPSRKIDTLIRTTAWPHPVIVRRPNWLYGEPSSGPYETLPYDGTFGDQMDEASEPHRGLTPDGDTSLLLAETMNASFLDEVIWH